MVDKAIDARRDEPDTLFLVAHVLKTASVGGLGIGTRVTLTVDAARRLRLSAAHTACHLLAYALNQETQDLWKKPTSLDSRGYHDLDAASCVFTQHDVGGSLDRYRLGKSLRKRGFDSARFVEEIPTIIAGVNRTLAKWIESDAAVRIDCAGPRLTDWRQWVCDLPGSSAFMSCGGTHVQRLREIDAMTAVASFDAAAGILVIRNEVRVAG
jgi:alanyl-tRNA synthetase